MPRPIANSLQTEIVSQVIAYVQRNGLHVNTRLTERGLAAECGVSRSPVRAALRFLASKGVVRRQHGGGYSLVHSAESLETLGVRVPQAPAERLSLKLLKDHLAGRLEDRFTEAELMRRYSVTRSVLLKGLERLSRQSVVRRRSGHGWAFLPSINTREAYWESYEFRLAIEPAAIRSPTFRIDEERFERSLRIHANLADGLLDRVSSARFFEINAEFHEMLSSFSGNRFFIEAIQHHNRLRRALEYEPFAGHERMLDSCREHLQILSALKEGDREWAASLMTHHLKGSQRSRLAFRTSRSKSGAPHTSS